MSPGTSRSSGLYTLPGTTHQLALVFKAAIGWYYRAHPRSSASWAYEWLKPLVTKAHDLLMEDSWYANKERYSSQELILNLLYIRYQPIMHHDNKPESEGPSQVLFTQVVNCVEEKQEEEDVLFALSNSLRNLNIKEPAPVARINIKISSDSARTLSRGSNSSHYQMHPLQEREE